MFKSLTPGRCLLLFFSSSFLVFTLVPRYQLVHNEGQGSGIVARQIIVGGSDPVATPTSTTVTTSTGTTSTPQTTSTTTTSPSTVPTTTSTTSTTTPTTPTTPATTPTTTTPTTTPTTPSPTTQQAPAPAQTTSKIETTAADGQVFTSFVTVSASPTVPSTTPSASGSSTGSSSSGSSKLSTGSIIGMSVCGGVALIGIIGFIVWKFTRKRVSDHFDDGEAIKWPELNNDNHSATAGGLSSEVSLSRGGSTHGYSASVGTASQSQVDLYGADPYAVPPLPHLNPNQPQPYRDDPNAGGYYDPYPGPAPPAFHDPPGSPGPRGEAIPMTQIPATRVRSPGPQLGLATGRASPAPSVGRQSPGPYAAIPRSPAPPPALSVGYGGAPIVGRQSPGPQDSYRY